jgi:hypothetical protein
VQRVINSQVNEIVGGGRREEIPTDMLPFDQRRAARQESRHLDEDTSPGGGSVHDDDQDDQDHDTPPFGTSVTTGASAPTVTGGPPAPDTEKVAEPPLTIDPVTGRAMHLDVRDRLIELDDLRRRGIISEEEFAAKKSELLNRI